MWAEFDKPVNWVANRGGCTTASALDLIQSHIEMDVQEVNKLPLERHCHYIFKVLRDGKDVIVEGNPDEAHKSYFRTGTAGKQVSFVGREDETINVYLGAREQFAIALSWDYEKGVCRLSIDNKHYELWQISQKALYSLFFG